MTYRIVIQSRLSSSRLPAKALLPIGGMPSLLLCALRTANAGARPVIATSTDPDDDAIQELMEAHGFPVCRGAREDVLSRFGDATRDLADDDLVVRVTADNMLPDGSMIADLVQAFREAGADHIGTDPRLPYGFGAEVFPVGALRRAIAAARDPYDREHVTPWIRRHLTSRALCPSRCVALVEQALPPCTMDTYEDYRVLRALFARAAEPVHADGVELCSHLYEAYERAQVVPSIAVAGKRFSRLQLGTAQLGMEYGIANEVGPLDDTAAEGLIACAARLGVTTFDTARGYGVAEERLGRGLPSLRPERTFIVTKLTALDDVDETASAAELRARVDRSVADSSRALRVPALPALLLHRSPHLSQWQGAVWQRLCEMKRAGQIGALGVSIYAPSELEVLDAPDVEVLQLPFHVLDRRWQSPEVSARLQAFRARGGVVFARSALLQGLLTLPPERWPPVPGADAAPVVQALQHAVRQLRREGMVDLCLAYVRAQSWVHGVVLGCETSAQLQQNVRLFALPPLTPGECAWLEDLLPAGAGAWNNPTLWSSARGSHERR